MVLVASKGLYLFSKELQIPLVKAPPAVCVIGDISCLHDSGTVVYVSVQWPAVDGRGGSLRSKDLGDTCLSH